MTSPAPEDTKKPIKRKVISPIKLQPSETEQIERQPSKKSPKAMLQRFDEAAGQGDVRISDMTFSILGRKFDKSRSEIVSMITDNGGKVVEKVTNKVTHLLCSGPEEFNTAKYNQAIERGIPIVFEEFLIRLVYKNCAIMDEKSHPVSPATAEACTNTVKLEINS
jgi:NAD-dependent DNA ligase